MHGIRTRKGAELRKREAFSSAARKARSAAAEAGGEAARGHPSSPTIELETVLERGPFLFGLVAEEFEPAGCAPFQGQWSKNAKYEYCYLFGNSIFEVSEGKFDIKAADNGSAQRCGVRGGACPASSLS